MAGTQSVSSKQSKPSGNGSIKPNILVIWGDDIGIANLSCYSSGLMGYRTPNIDRIAEEGMRFTDSYGEQSCTAGRASFITGQCGYRTGLTKVGVPGATVGLKAEDPKEFPEFNKKFRPRGVLRSQATTTDDGTVDTRFGRVGKQRIEDTGPLTKKRMETCDDEFAAAAKDFIKRQATSKTPFFCWLNTTHMHLRTHPKPTSIGQAGRWQSPYHDTMIDHDTLVGDVLNLLDELGIADNTIVMYSTDNGPHMNSWPDGGMTPFRSEKDTNWEGAFRVPLLLRWPAAIPAGVVSNEIVQHNDWLPTFLAAAGDPDIKEKLKKGHQAAGKTFKVHIDGYNLLPYLKGETKKPERKGFIYFDDDGQLVALRFDNWKCVFLEQRAEGTLRIWAEPFTSLRVPKLYNLRTDPYERADITSNTYYDWFLNHDYIALAAQSVVSEFLETFKEFPPRQKSASFTIDQAMEKMAAVAGSNR